jgi:hypothetical protein
MSQEGRYMELREKTQQLLHGSLKHARAAALAAVLVPLASVAVSPAMAQGCPSGCPPPPVASVPSPCDFVTSGGFVLTDTTKEANFGAHGGCKLDGFWGHVNYEDHGTGYHLDSIAITGYLTPSPGSNIRDICGTATTNRAETQPVFFRLRLVDNGEPGIADTFGILVSNDNLTVTYAVNSRLLNNGMGGGGNVQLHNDNPSTTAPSPLPTEAQMCGVLAGQTP